jgi:hypothetical protein
MLTKPIMKKNIILALVLAVMLCALGVTLVRRQASRTVSRPIGYTIVFQTTGYDLEGNFRPVEMETRYVSAQGNFRGVKHEFIHGREKVWFGETGRGQFLVKPNEKQLDYVSQFEPTVRTMEILRTSKDFNRIEKVAGYDAAVMRMYHPGLPENSYDDIYYAPALNGDLIKLVSMREGQLHLLVEPIAIVKGEPDPANLAHEEYPVDTTRFEEMHRPEQAEPK